MSGNIHLTVPYIEGGVPGQNILKSSDSYTRETGVVFAIESEEIILQGNPRDQQLLTDPKIPLLNPNEYRVFRNKLPEPNAFGVLEQYVSLKEKKYLWKLKGIRINRNGEQQKLAEGNPKFDKFTKSDADEETSSVLVYDPPLKQKIILGCKPCLGYYFPVLNITPKAEPVCEMDCSGCPCCRECLPEKEPGTAGADAEKPILLGRPMVVEIMDGDMADIGFGNIDVSNLVRKDLFPQIMGIRQNSPCKSIAKIEMKKENTGDRDFFIFERDQSHLKEMFFSANMQTDVGNEGYPLWSIPDGSTTSSLNDLMNRTIWLNKAEGANNCLAWDDEFYFTVLDNTRGQSIILNKKEEGTKSVSLVTRHVQIYQIEAIVELVEVTLEAELLQYIYRINRNLMNKWGYGIDRATHALSPHYPPFNNLDLKTKEPDEEEVPFRAIDINFNGSTNHQMHNMENLHKTLIGQHYIRDFGPPQIKKGFAGGKRKK